MSKRLISLLVLWPTVNGLAFPQVSAAQNAVKPEPAAGPNASWRISCRGTTSVPMTADAEQGLPLQIIASLKCGEEVVVLSDLGGYTINVRTSDGKTGYIAAMYVKKASPSRRDTDPVNLKNGVARWKNGTAGCDQFMGINGSLVESLNVNGVTVQVSLRDTRWKLRTDIAVSNGSSHLIEINPSKFSLDSHGPHGKPLPYQDPELLAKDVTRQGLWTDADTVPAVFQARAATSSTGNSGTLNLSYKTPEPPRLASANVLVPRPASEREIIRNQRKPAVVNSAKQIQSLALQPGTMQPNDTISGAVWFERDKNAEQLVLRIPFADVTFEFPLTLKPAK